MFCDNLWRLIHLIAFCYSMNSVRKEPKAPIKDCPFAFSFGKLYVVKDVWDGARVQTYKRF